MSDLGDALLAAVRQYEQRPESFSTALYLIGRPGHWAVHVPRRGGAIGYDLARGDDLAVTLIQALNGENLISEKEALASLDRQPGGGYIKEEPPPPDWSDVI